MTPLKLLEETYSLFQEKRAHPIQPRVSKCEDGSLSQVGDFQLEQNRAIWRPTDNYCLHSLREASPPTRITWRVPPAHTPIKGERAHPQFVRLQDSKYGRKCECSQCLQTA
jgi:hypothetical protein